MIRLLLTLVLVCFTAPLQAAWLGLCDDQIQASTPGDFRFNTADGAAKVLRLVEHSPPESCVATVLPVTADAVQWFALLNAGQAAQIGKSRAVVLQGKQNGKHFAGEVSLDNGVTAPPKPLPWPLYLDLREHLDITPFGQEERASLERNVTGLAFRCLAGRRPAGFVLSAGQDLLPQLPGLGLSLSLRGDSGFIWSASYTAGSDHRDPLPLAELQAGKEWRTQNIDLTPVLNPQNKSDSWTLLCPYTPANLTVNSMQLTAPEAVQRGRATWLWREAIWQQAKPALWKQLHDLNITTLYITIPLTANLSGVSDPQALRTFVTHAGKQGIAVWGVAGDPLAVLASERESWLKRAKAYAAYNRDVEEAARLKGMQYDIEPYLAPGYAQAPEAWKQAYIDTLAALRKVSAMALEAAVPVWWAEETLGDKPLLEAVADWVDGVAVMDYRTDPWRIQQQTLPFLIWGAHHRKPVRIALEAGPVAEETRLVFHRTETGELWATRVGEITLLLRLARPGVNAGGITFGLTQEITVSGEAVSFHGRLDEMETRLPQLERALGAWPTFAGLALHEVLSP
ncbi:hypothetical protein B0F88_1038 [Methylobacter tundripaludum]|uniref:Uncharacterized protein n=1 Tax=Methylobacter tundripaludum TaxID=173365 RepID=A0A2S6H511_9GAMM|nr:hypothetical protein [Methylobacter tundripaludum]PPK72578.1 hypothetical protein B0F88_1038 [Methylobacter tundripaludum]